MENVNVWRVNYFWARNINRSFLAAEMAALAVISLCKLRSWLKVTPIRSKESLFRRVWLFKTRQLPDLRRVEMYEINDALVQNYLKIIVYLLWNWIMGFCSFSLISNSNFRALKSNSHLAKQIIRTLSKTGSVFLISKKNKWSVKWEIINWTQNLFFPFLFFLFTRLLSRRSPGSWQSLSGDTCTPLMA